jgi:hypothetical protein
MAHSTVEFLIDPKRRERLLYDKTITTDELIEFWAFRNRSRKN